MCLYAVLSRRPDRLLIDSHQSRRKTNRKDIDIYAQQAYLFKAQYSAGSATGGQMCYALGMDAIAAPKESTYTSSIPTGTDAGTYYVCYKVKGDASHSNNKREKS